MIKIETGHRVQILAGKTVWEKGHPVPSKRPRTVTVAAIRAANSQYLAILTPEDRKNCDREITQTFGGTMFLRDDTDEATLAQRAAIIDRWLTPYLEGRQPLIVEWTGRNFAFLDDVVMADQSRKNVGVSKLQQMVPGSRWRVSQDVVLTVDIPNPDHTAEAMRLDRALPTYAEALKRASWKYPAVATVEVGSIKAGTLLEVSGKQQGFYLLNSNWQQQLRGTYLPFKAIEGEIIVDVPITHYSVRKAGGGTYLNYRVLEPVVRAELIPQVKQYVLRDRETGQYFTGVNYDNHRTSLGLSDSYTKAKKYDDIGKVKASILDWSGYFLDMPYGDRPDWIGNSKIDDLPATWGVACFDKLAKTELETIDIQPWYKRAWELRGLTIKHGGVVRKLYNEMDKKGEVSDFPHVMAIYQDPDDHYELRPADVKAFEEAVKTVTEGSGLKRGQFRRAKDSHSMAISFRDPNDAFMMRMAYSGRARMAVLNMETLTEVVEQAKA